MAEVNLKHTINRINSNEIEPIYSLFGNEAFLQKFFIDYISSKFLNKNESITYLNLDDDKESLLLSELSSYSLFNEKKVIIVRRIKKLSKNAKNELFDYIQSPNNYYCLILISEKYDFKNSLQKELEKISTTIDVRVPFENKIKEWVTYYVKTRKYEINLATINDLIDLAGGKSHGSTRKVYVINSLNQKNRIRKLTSNLNNGDVVFIETKQDMNLWNKLQESMGLMGQIATLLAVIQSAQNN